MSLKLTQPQAERLRRLLHMEYTLSELAEEIGCSRYLIEKAIASGCPCRTEGNRRFLIGDEFAAWYRKQPRAKNKVKLEADEAYCLRCRAACKIVDATITGNPSRGVERLTGKCAVCGAPVNRLRRQAEATR